MNDWKTYKLGDICTKIGSGATPRGGKEAYFETEEYSLIRSQNVLDFSFSTNGLAFISEQQANELKNVVIEKDDILLNITGDSVTRVCQVPDKILPARVNQHVAIIRGNASVINQKYLKYYLLEPSFKSYMLGMSSSGATRNALTKVMIENFKIEIPDLATQTQIAQILTSLDDKIELNLQMNQTLEAMAQAIFKEWFVNFNYPNFDGQLENGLPKGWRMGKLGEICEITDFVANGSFASLKENVTLYDEENFALYVRTTDNNNNFTNSLKYTDEKSYNFLKKSRLKGDEIIISNVGDVGTVFKPPVWLEKPMTLGSNALMILGNKLNNYLYHKLKSDEGQHSIQGLISGSAQPKFNKTAFRNMEILIPDINVIETFNSLYVVLYEKIVSNKSQIQTLTQTRDTLLPKLMSGKICLNTI